MSAPAIIVYSLDQATAALSVADECHREVIILSERNAAASLGASVFQSMIQSVRETFPDLPFTAALGCGEDAGHALAAIRQGVKAIVLSDNCPAHARIADLARQHDVRLLSDEIYDEAENMPPLDLMESADPLAACREFLHTGISSPAPEHP